MSEEEYDQFIASEIYKQLMLFIYTSNITTASMSAKNIPITIIYNCPQANEINMKTLLNHLRDLLWNDDWPDYPVFNLKEWRIVDDNTLEFIFWKSDIMYNIIS